MSARGWLLFHLWATLAWAVMIVPTVVWLRNSILWVALMSIYACVIGHWSAYQAARAERNGLPSACPHCGKAFAKVTSA